MASNAAATCAALIIWPRGTICSAAARDSGARANSCAESPASTKPGAIRFTVTPPGRLADFQERSGVHNGCVSDADVETSEMAARFRYQCVDGSPIGDVRLPVAG